MRLYTLTGATQVDDPQYGKFEAGPDGAFDFPNEMSDKMHGFHIGGVQAWETDAERATRLAAEELDRLRDPKTLLETIQAMSANQQALVAAMAGAAQQVKASPEEAPASKPEAPAVPAPAKPDAASAKPKTSRSRSKGTATTE